MSFEPDADGRPTEINIAHYGGDTMTILVTVDPAVVAGRVFQGQVRIAKSSPRVDANFLVIPSAEGATVVLQSEDSQRLTARGKYTGYWDLQLTPVGGGDPTNTIAYGQLILDPDVTRNVA